MTWILFDLLAPCLYSITNYIENFILEKKANDPIAITLFGGVGYFVLGLFIFGFNGIHLLPLTQMVAICRELQSS